MLTADRLKQLLSYDERTGLFHWLANRRFVKQGDVAGSPSVAHGYRIISVDGKNYKAHRLAWLYITGEFPRRDVDHINGSRSDNRWANLRNADDQLNMENRRHAQKNNSCGYLGVRWDRGKWRAALQLNGKKINAGRFKTAEEAHAAYVTAKRIHHPGCTL